MNFPFVCAIDWDFITGVPQEVRVGNTFHEKLNEIHEDENDPRVIIADSEFYQSIFEFFDFSQVIGALISDFPESTKELIAFGGPIMGLDIFDAASIKDLETSNAYAVISPRSINILLNYYANIDFDSLEPIYHQVIEVHQKEFNYSPTFLEFRSYCETWAEYLRMSTKRKMGVLCSL